jgi:hypothetical protein
MKKNCCHFLIFFVIGSLSASGQNVLPSITVKNLNEKIIVSWLNQYQKPIQNILIQRSYDSLKNYSTIGTVLNPQNVENGYPDLAPPYNKMYYRLAITFEGGTYEIGKPARPVKDIPELEPMDIRNYPKEEVNINTNLVTIETSNLKKDTADLKPNKIDIKNKKDQIKEKAVAIITPDSSQIKAASITPKKIIETAYPSSRIFTSKQNIVIIHITDVNSKKYSIRFYDEDEKLTFSIKKITEDYLYVEKSNFVHAGWFRFEIYEDGILFEKNKVFISKDKSKSSN